MLEVRLARRPGASGEGTLPVPHLDEMPQEGTGPIAVCLVGVVAVVQRDLVDRDAVPAASGQREDPRAVPAIGSRSGVVGGKIPFAVRWSVAGTAGFSDCRGFQDKPCATVGGGMAVPVGEGEAEPASRAFDRGLCELADECRVERSIAGSLAGPLRPPVQQIG